MLIDVHELVGRAGEIKEFDLDLTVPLDERKATVYGKAAVIGAEESVIARFDARSEVSAQCSRCLRDMNWHFEKLIEAEFKETPGNPEDLKIEDGKIDIAIPLREEILTAEPITLLHDENCRGLCPVCGKDRNEIDCGHEEVVKTETTKPLAAIKNFLKRKKP